MTEEFFIPKPTPTTDTVPGRGDLTIYHQAGGHPPLWWSGGRMPLPEVGQRIFITMNGIGWAIVMGYFSSENYLGVMTKATNPPAWLRRQNREGAKDTTKPQWYRDGIGCEFGTEIAAKRPKKTTAAL